MNAILKYAGAATLAAGLALTAATPSNAHDWHGGGAAAAGFAAGAVVGAAASSAAYNDGYYGGYGYDGYAYAPGPGYYNDYAYAPRGRANYWSRSRALNHGEGPGCIQSPASHEYTSCD